MLTKLKHINIIAVEPRLLHSNLNFARQFGCCTRQFSIANDNSTMKKPKTGKNGDDKYFVLEDIQILS